MKSFIIVLGLIVSNLAFAWEKELIQKVSDQIDSIGEGVVSELTSLCLDKRQVPACLSLGKYYDFKDSKEGAVFYQKACQLLSPVGCLLGGYSLERQGKESQSNDLYTMGCFSYEDANNCLALAQNYREKRSFTDSLNMFDRSCKLKNGQGCFFAYEISGYLSLQSRYKYYLQNGCALKHINSCIYLAEYSKGSGDLATARYAYKEACLMGIDESCEGYQKVNEGGVLKKELAWLQKLKDKFFLWLEDLFPIGPEN